jgi:D-alanine-D-alanine ligase
MSSKRVFEYAKFTLADPRFAPAPTPTISSIFADAYPANTGLLSGLVGLPKLPRLLLVEGHPLESMLFDCWIVGQMPERQQRVDDKYETNAALRARGLPVAVSIIVGTNAQGDISAFESLTQSALAERGLTFPLIVKPVRGRGSQGVTLVDNHAQFVAALASLFQSGAFGSLAIVEAYLPGEELTLTVMTQQGANAGPLVLPPVRRLNHVDGVAPYNGTVAVTRNSAVLTAAEAASPPVAALMNACARAFEAIGALAPIRIDCRANLRGDYRIFDVNMKPNMTGVGRPGRSDQDSLSAIAARGIGWDYGDLLEAMLQTAWRVRRA